MRSGWKHKYVHLSLKKRENHEIIKIRNRDSIFRADMLENLLKVNLSLYNGVGYGLLYLDNFIKNLKLGEIVFTKKRTRRIHGDLMKGKTRRQKKKNINN